MIPNSRKRSFRESRSTDTDSDRELTEPLKDPKLCFKGLRKLRLVDVLYGNIHLSRKAQLIASSPEYRRLHNIHQLGVAWLVFPPASHTRGEHCFGVSFLSRLVGEHLMRSQPELELSEVQVCWLELAGLMHDIGHGPFSHGFENAFQCGKSSDVPNHESRSKIIARFVMSRFSDIFTEEDIQWVTWLIDPKESEGAPNEKYAFLGQIVCNNIHGMDTDKMDYLARDALYLGVKKEIWWNIREVLLRTKIIDGLWCFASSDSEALRGLSEKRLDFHQRFYAHPEVLKLEYMVYDILSAMDEVLEIRKGLRNPEKFCQLDDNIFQTISTHEQEECPQVQTARDMYERLVAGKSWWSYVGLLCVSSENESNPWPPYVSYHKVKTFDATIPPFDGKWFEWSIFVNAQAPHNALPKIPFYKDNATEKPTLLLHLLADAVVVPAFAKKFFHILIKEN